MRLGCGTDGAGCGSSAGGTGFEGFGFEGFGFEGFGFEGFGFEGVGFGGVGAGGSSAGAGCVVRTSTRSKAATANGVLDPPETASPTRNEAGSSMSSLPTKVQVFPSNDE
jgi:hypothetical protein